MTQPAGNIDVYLEIGSKRTFSGAIEWPGWCRSGRDVDAALQALVDYGPRYARVSQASQIAFHPPSDRSDLVVVERLAGDASTDFGAPGIAPSHDARPMDEAELQRLQILLQACWHEFDRTIAGAVGKDLRTGPRGGGRTLDKIVQHVLDADGSYLGRLAWKGKIEAEGVSQRLAQTRQAILDALAAAAHGDLPTRGPRGGVMWTPRYFARRVAWHVLDHAWEVEDRT
jgi:hypothetical protein